MTARMVNELFFLVLGAIIIQNKSEAWTLNASSEQTWQSLILWWRVGVYVCVCWLERIRLSVCTHISVNTVLLRAAPPSLAHSGRRVRGQHCVSQRRCSAWHSHTHTHTLTRAHKHTHNTRDRQPWESQPKQNRMYIRRSSFLSSSMFFLFETFSDFFTVWKANPPH